MSTRLLLLVLFAALVAVGWAYGPTLIEIGERWVDDPQYTHGFLVPLFSVYLLWRGRDRLRTGEFRPRWWGAGIVLFGAGLRFGGHVFYQPWIDPASLLVVLAGLAAASGGRQALAWSGPAILFLAFTIPLPYRFQIMLGGTLQRIATDASTYVLQTLGFPAVAEGNIIFLTRTPIGVVEACSGLSMMVTFFALATAVAIRSNRGWVERVLVVLSAAPVAVIANVVRISVTGALFEMDHQETARAVFHDFAGWLMMPVALALLLCELEFFRRALVPVSDEVAT